jgi:hypothetical protein
MPCSPSSPVRNVEKGTTLNSFLRNMNVNIILQDVIARDSRLENVMGVYCIYITWLASRVTHVLVKLFHSKRQQQKDTLSTYHIWYTGTVGRAESRNTRTPVVRCLPKTGHLNVIIYVRSFFVEAPFSSVFGFARS